MFKPFSELRKNTELGDVHLSLGCSQSSQRACPLSVTNAFVGGKILSASVLYTQPQCLWGPVLSQAGARAALVLLYYMNPCHIP